MIPAMQKESIAIKETGFLFVVCWVTTNKENPEPDITTNNCP
jgi:hypothetical protein